MKNQSFKNLIILATLLLNFFASETKAALFYFEPEKGEYSRGDVFLVNLMVDTQGERINAGQLEITFPQDKIEVLEISEGDSIFTFWPQRPSFSNETGKIFLVGGVPFGFEGKGKILKVVFLVNFSENEKGFAEINLSPDSQILLNDGQGTRAKLETKKAVFSLFSKPAKVPKNEWEKEIKEDKIPPEPFTITLGKDPFIFDGKYFIAFNTIDKQTGIDHYEIKEGKRPWKRGESPYLLADQSLRSKILVKAVDKAGNERIAELLPIFPPKPFYLTLKFWAIVSLFLFLIGLILISQKIRKKFY